MSDQHDGTKAAGTRGCGHHVFNMRIYALVSSSGWPGFCIGALVLVVGGVCLSLCCQDQSDSSVLFYLEGNLTLKYVDFCRHLTWPRVDWMALLKVLFIFIVKRDLKELKKDI